MKRNKRDGVVTTKFRLAAINGAESVKSNSGYSVVEYNRRTHVRRITEFATPQEAMETG